MAVILERPTGATVVLDGLQRREAQALVRRLESWLPAEEQRLSRARAAQRARPRQEAEWRDLLRLYERLCEALARRG